MFGPHRPAPPDLGGDAGQETVFAMDVLLVEDDALVRESLNEDLSDAGLSVVGACCAEDGLRAAEADPAPPSVVVTDVELGPGMDGLTLAEEARRRWPDIAVVVMTGNRGKLRGRSARARERCLLKPLSPSLLIAEVNGLLGRPGR